MKSPRSTRIALLALAALAGTFFASAPAAASGDLCGEGTCVPFFVHGLSHHLGLDVHDPAPRGFPLAPGMVITIERGLYLPDEGIGIRIEDDVLVTEEGREVLTTPAPKDPEVVEARVGSE